ncbi:glycosyltransferase family 50 protein [Ramaria rubella]|nr:glycosyltransferase family 50 protein [Ramaria rubella]
MHRVSFSHALIFSALIRGGLVLYSEYHDAHLVVKYTDVDYRVFTDAARFLLHPTQDGGRQAQGKLGVNVGDPYLRETYRYTPLLALLMTPNLFLRPSFGKLIFSLCDLLVGIMLYNIFCDFPPVRSTTMQDIRRQATFWVSSLWLLNPLVFTISTRGSSESVLGLLVVGTLYLVMKGRGPLAALLFGLSVHWKIYPIVYGASILSSYCTPSTKSITKNWFVRLANPRRITFAVLSAGTFVTVTGILYLIWGYPVLWHSYLYHLGRLDHRHNFSPYFYPTYLSYPSKRPEMQTSKISQISHPMLSFIPQMTLAIGAGFLLGNETADLPFAWFIQTVIFVTFNKVCTSQYFIWYIWFLPLFLPRLRISARDAILLVGVWVGAQALWLSVAYRLEFLGSQVYLSLWFASLIFLSANCWVLAKIMQAYSR